MHNPGAQSRKLTICAPDGRIVPAGRRVHPEFQTLQFQYELSL